MTAPETAPLRHLALNILTREAGSGADAKTLADATHRAYDGLARVLVPLIGDVGVAALTARAWHLAQRDCPALADARDSTQAGEPWAQLRFSLERQDDPAVAAEAAAGALSILLTLLITFIGEPLTMNLVRRAWPDGPSDLSLEDLRAFDIMDQGIVMGEALGQYEGLLTGNPELIAGATPAPRRRTPRRRR